MRVQVTVGASVCVRWEVTQSVTEMDFIGIFECLEDPAAPIDIDGLLDARLRGVSNSHSGEIHWVMEEMLFVGSE